MLLNKFLKPKKFIFIIFWALFVIICLAGQPIDALAGAFFFAGIFAPAMLLLRALLAQAGIRSPLDFLAGAALAWIALALLFILRGFLGIHPCLFDLGVAAGVWLVAWPRLPAAFLIGMFRRWMLSGGGRADLWWGLLLLPVLFLAVRSGYEVRVGQEVHYYGLNFVDFGNLVAVVNLLNASPGLPMQAIEGAGPYSYHWLFFAVPAWIASLGGFQSSPSGALTLANYAGAFVFYKTLSRTCAVALQESGRSKKQWCAWGATLGIFALSIFSFYVFIAERLNLQWGAGNALRNHLLLQLPNSINIFGNNTLALTMILLSVLAIVEWNKGERGSYAILAAVLVAFVPGLSATMVPAVASGFLVAALCGAIKRPVRILFSFMLFGAIALGLFWWMGFFSGRGGAVLCEFDGGLFVRNIMGSSPLIIVAMIWCLTNARTGIAVLFSGLVVGTCFLPTFFDLKGGMGADFSMKNFSLLVAAGAPLAVVMIVDAVTLWRRGALVFSAIILLFVAAGSLNSIGYAASYPWRVFVTRVPAVKVDSDLYDALIYIKAHSVPTAIVANPLVDGVVDGNPTTTISGRRSLLFNEFTIKYDKNIFNFPEILQLKTQFFDWVQLGCPEGKISADFARRANFAVIDRELPLCDWECIAVFGKVQIYRSRGSSFDGNLEIKVHK